MRKVLAMIMTVVLMATVAPASVVLADTNTSDSVEKVLLIVKEKVEIPDLLTEFESSVSDYADKTQYHFTWRDEKYEKSISLSADEQGRIINYRDYSSELLKKKLPGISKKEIKLFAEEFLKKALPEMYSDISDVLSFREDNYNNGGGVSYSFAYERRKNNIPVKDNNVHITVGISKDGELFVNRLSSDIDYDTKFVETKSEIENFVQKYKETFPIELVYRNEYNPEWKATGKPRSNSKLIYRIKDNNAGFISVETGEILKEDINDAIFRNEAAMDSASGGASLKSQLTEKEIKEIKAIEGLLSVEELEKKVKSIPFIKFPDGIKLESSSLSKNYNGEYIYNIYYNNNNDEKYSYLSMSVTAKEGKLLNYYCNYGDNSHKNDNLSEMERKQANTHIDEFLKSAAPEEMQSSALESNEERYGYINSYYHRLVNGIKHIDDGIRVSFDGKKSVITSFSLNFTEGEFDDPEKAIDAEKAYEILTDYTPVIKMYLKTGGRYVESATVEKKGVVLDALSGNIDKGVYGAEYREYSYSDISGHWVEDAAIRLGEIQIGFSGDKLEPDKKVTQEEYLRLLTAGIYNVYYENDSEFLYQYLKDAGIITEEEKAPADFISREEAFVFLIRMAKLEHIAKLENIFKVQFADGDLLSAGKIGYCALLDGLGVISGNGGYIRPLDKLTRAETITMLYKYLLTI